MTVADVVERVYRQARSAPGCSKPQEAVLRAVVEYAVDRIVHTRGELVSLPVAPIRRLFPRVHLRARCIAAWLGLDECIVMLGPGRVILSLPCVREKLGL